MGCASGGRSPSSTTGPVVDPPTSPPVLVDPIIFSNGDDAGNNVISIIYGNGGEGDLDVVGTLNPDFARASEGFFFSGLSTNTDPASGEVLANGNALPTVGATTGLDDVDNLGGAAYTYFSATNANQAAIIRIDELTPTNTSVIALTAVYTNTDGIADPETFDFEVTINVDPFDISQSPILITSEFLGSELVTVTTNHLDLTVNGSGDRVRVDYTSPLASFVNRLEVIEYPPGTRLSLGRDLLPGITVGANEEDQQQGVRNQTRPLEYTINNPGLSSVPVFLTITGSGNFVGSANSPQGTLSFEQLDALTGNIAYRNETIVMFGNSVGLDVNESPSLRTPLDRGSGMVRYQITEGGVDGIEIDPVSGHVTVAADTETGDYTLEVTVSSTHGGDASDTFDIRVIQELSGSILYDDIRVTQGFTGVGIVDTTDLTEGTGTISYEITSGATNGIIIDNRSGQITVDSSGLSLTNYPLIVRVSSSDGGSDTTSLVATVTRGLTGRISYTNLTVESRTSGVGNVDESNLTRGTGTITYEIVSTDVPGITIDNSTGQIRVADTTAARENAYEVDVRVSSSEGGENIARANVRVTEPLSGNILYNNIAIASGSVAIGSVVDGGLTEGTGDINYEITGVEIDGATVNPDSVSGISINQNSGQIIVDNSTTEGNYTLEVTVSSSDGGSTTANLTVQVSGALEALSGTISYTNLTVREGTSGVGNVDNTELTPGTGDLTYRINSAPVPGITIDDDTGQIQVTNTTAPRRSAYEVSVIVSSSHGGNTTARLDVRVITELTGAISYNNLSVVSGNSGFVNVNDSGLTEGTGDVTYEIISGATNGIAIDDDSGQITTDGSLAVGSYPLGVRVSSSDGGETSANLTINAAMGNEMLSGTISYTNLTIREGTSGVGNVDESNLTRGTGDITYSITSAPIAGISVVTNTGQIQVDSTVTEGDYTVQVSASSSHGGNTPVASLTVRVVTELSGDISYNDASLVVGRSGFINVNDSLLNEGTGNITYEITSGGASGININDGLITVGSAATTGVTNYALEVTVSSDDGGSATANLTIEVIASPAPSGGSISYTNLTVREGTSGVGNVDDSRLVRGTSPVRYSITVTPASSGITINTNTGQIQVASTTSSDDYTVQVRVDTDDGSNTVGDDLTIRVTTELTGAISYNELAVPFGSSGFVNVDDSGLTAGTGDITYEITSSPVNGIRIDDDSGQVSVDSTTRLNNYVVDVRVSSSDGGEARTNLNIRITNPVQGSVSSSDGGEARTNLNIRITNPVQGSFSYADIETITGTTATGSPDLSRLAPGTGNITYEITSSPVAGIDIDPNSGEVTLSGTTTVGAYAVAVRAFSSDGGDVTTTVTTRIAAGIVGGSFTYPSLASRPASSVVVGTATTITPNLSSLRNQTGFNIRPVSSNIDLGGVSIDENGVINVASEKVGTAQYRVVATGVNGSEVSTDITIRNTLSLAPANLPINSLTTITTIQTSDGSQVNFGNTHLSDNFIIDNNRNVPFNFGSDDLLSYAYHNLSGDTELSYNSQGGYLAVGSLTQGAVSYGLAINPDLMVQGDLRLTVNIGRNSAPTSSGGGYYANTGYVVMLSDGRTSSTTGVSSGARYVEAQIPQSQAARTSDFTFGGGVQTLTLYFVSPVDQVVEIHGLSIEAR